MTTDREFKIMWLDTVDSTQEEVRRNIAGYDNLTVVAAMFQTAGKGQRGNKWSSGRGENLTFSVLLKPGADGIRPVPAKEQFDISMVSALAVKQLLEGLGLRCSIKWPNDIYVGDKKICGMLIENLLSADGYVENSIIGIGININQTVFPPELMNPTSVCKVTRKTYDIKPLLEAFTREFGGLLGLESKALKELFTASLFKKDVLANYTDTKTGEVFSGTIKGIDEDALLIIETPAGITRRYAFKEVSYIL